MAVVGGRCEGRLWAERNQIDVSRVVSITAARQVVELDPTAIHIVVLPGFLDWRNPHYFLLRTELNFMRVKGATLEWA